MEIKRRNLRPAFDLTFWKTLYYKKLEEMKLSEDPVPLTGTIKYGSQQKSELFTELEFDCFSFTKTEISITKHSYYSIGVRGMIKVFNKLEDYELFLSKQENRKISFNEVFKGDEEILTKFQTKTDTEEPLSKTMMFFYIPMFINLKTFQFIYSFFELQYDLDYSMIQSTVSVDENDSITFDIDYESLSNLNSFCLNPSQSLFYDCSLEYSQNSSVLLTYILDEFYGSEMAASLTEDISIPVFVLKSPLVLNYIKNLFTYKQIQAKKTKINIFKNINKDAQKTFGVSPFSIKLLHKQPSKIAKNFYSESQNLNLKEFLSKENLVEEQSNLNVKLMKWRLEPDLQLDNIQSLKVLLVGSGTLGCNMGRLVSAWGIKNMSFIDYGNVSYSNLTRQSLFTLNDFDTQGNGLGKAEACVKNLKNLVPSLNLSSHSFKIPMPGHFCTDKMIDEEFQNLQKLEELVSSHDIIFNILDTREARYFPTLFSSIYNKLCISVGLGYDNFVIVKHGYRNFKHLLSESKP
jgi:ubiquitin-like modifier-activating enzyme ATG7